jgi:hypothetical protein
MPQTRPANDLALLRAALDALALGDDAPDLDRLRATLLALDPALCGDALPSVGWGEATGMPAPDAIAALHELRATALTEQDTAADLPDEGVLQATSLDPELGARLRARRSFVRFVRRNALFPGAAEVHTDGDGPWWTWDAVLPDGRWGRIRIAGAADRTPVRVELAYKLSIDDLSAQFAYEDTRRCVIGPAAWDAQGQLVGVWATVESLTDGVQRRLILDRMHAEDVDAKGALVVPIAVPPPRQAG